MIANIDPIQPGDAASPNLWNSRYAAITTVLNGNVDSDNLKNGAVTREKIAAGAISSDKLSVERYVDSNGWTVSDYGGYKRYSRTGSINITQNTLYGYHFTGINFPAGCTFNDIVGSHVAAQDQAIIIEFSTNHPTEVCFNVLRPSAGAITSIVGSWSITFEK